jgi:hypothetical protein
MITFRLAPAALAALMLTTPLAAPQAADLVVGDADLPAAATVTVAAPPIAGAVTVPVAAPPVQVVYVYPTSPSTFVPFAGLPSFLFQPGAPLPEIGTYVVHAVPVPAVASYPLVIAAGDIDCDQLPGPVQVLPPDTFDLDKDGDGIGCEPEDR